MIVYRLICAAEHQFEGWFRSGEDYDHQLGAGSISCPVCDSSEIARLPSAPHVQAGLERRTNPTGEEHPIELHKLLEMLYSITEDVGDAFPEEARKIHYREVPARGIRGRASPKDVEDLEEEGISVLPLPPVADPFKLH